VTDGEKAVPLEVCEGFLRIHFQSGALDGQIHKVELGPTNSLDFAINGASRVVHHSDIHSRFSPYPKGTGSATPIRFLGAGFFVDSTPSACLCMTRKGLSPELKKE
jgi:hypothetical protein